MSFLLDALFSSSTKTPRYSQFLDHNQVHLILSKLIKPEHSYGSKISSKVISALKSSPQTQDLISYDDFKHQTRETELVAIIKQLHQDNFISHHQYRAQSRAVQSALKNIRQQESKE